MVYIKIRIIRGLPIDSKTLRVLIGHRFPTQWDEWNAFRKLPKYKDGHIDDIFSSWILESEIGSFLEKKLKLRIYTPPCCAENNNFIFYLGREIVEMQIEDLFNNGVVFEQPQKEIEAEDIHLKNISRIYALDIEPKTIYMLDDCTSCS